jgi:hypothetical protein
MGHDTTTVAVMTAMTAEQQEDRAALEACHMGRPAARTERGF